MPYVMGQDGNLEKAAILDKSRVADETQAAVLRLHDRDQIENARRSIEQSPDTVFALQALVMNAEFQDSVDLLEDLRQSRNDGKWSFIVEEDRSPELRFGSPGGRGYRTADMEFTTEQIPKLEMIIDDYLGSDQIQGWRLTEEYALSLFALDNDRDQSVVRAIGMFTRSYGEVNHG